MKWKTYNHRFIITNTTPVSKADCICEIEAGQTKHASLIAAAPDLLEALEEITNKLTDSHITGLKDLHAESLRDFLDAGLTENDYRESIAIYVSTELLDKTGRKIIAALSKAKGS